MTKPWLLYEPPLLWLDFGVRLPPKRCKRTRDRYLMRTFPTNVAETVDGLFTPPSSRLSEFEKRDAHTDRSDNRSGHLSRRRFRWSPMWGRLRWVDMLVGDVLTLIADGTVNRRH
jgi:hypothetical protein